MTKLLTATLTVVGTLALVWASIAMSTRQPKASRDEMALKELRTREHAADSLVEMWTVRGVPDSVTFYQDRLDLIRRDIDHIKR